MNRILGASEHLLSLLAKTKPINVVLCATIKGQISIKQLTAALTWVQQRHPLLSVRIVTDNHQQPRFVSEGVSSIPLRVIERLQEEHWCYEVEQELIRPFSPTEGPLIRVVLLRSPEVEEIIVTFDHCIGDGLSGVYLIRDILHHISEPNIKSDRLPKPDSCEALIPSSTCEYSQDNNNLENEKTTKSNLLVLQNRHKSKEILENEQNSLLHWCLTVDDTAKLLRHCREQQTTVHGAICASFLLSIANEIGSHDSTFLKCMSPISLRNYLQPPVNEDFGAYYTRELTYHQIHPETNFWEIAREVKQQIHQITAHDKIFAHVLKVKAFLNTRPDPQQLRQYVNRLISSELTVTNLGSLDIPEQFGLLQLQQLHLTVAGIAPIIVGVATLGGKMFVTCRYLKTVIPQVCAENINKLAMQWLLAST